MIDENEIDIWIEHVILDFLDILAKFVAIPSIAKQNTDGFPFGRACADMLTFIENEMLKIGLESDNVGQQVVIGSLPGIGEKGSSKTIGIACHGDVVPPDGVWETDPFKLHSIDNWLIGRGVTDNKGATVVALFALRYLNEHKIKLRNRVNLYVGSAEEIGMPDMDYLLTQRVLPDFTLVPDAGFPVCYGEKGRIHCKIAKKLETTNLVSFETSNFENSVAGSAIATFVPLAPVEDVLAKLSSIDNISFEETNGHLISIKFFGLAKHSASPDGGIDAIGSLARLLISCCLISGDGIETLAWIGKVSSDFHGKGMGVPLEDSESGKITTVLTAIRFLEQELHLEFDIRYPVSANALELISTLKLGFTHEGFLISQLRHSPKALVELSPLIWDLCDLANQTYGTKDVPYIMGGGTYARKMQPAVAYGLGVPSIPLNIPFPPGNGRAHQPNEAVYLPRLKKAIKIYIQALIIVDKYL